MGTDGESIDGKCVGEWCRLNHMCKKRVGFLLVLLIGLLSLTSPFKQWLSLPSEMRLMQKASIHLPFLAEPAVANPQIVDLGMIPHRMKNSSMQRGMVIAPRSIGNTRLIFKLFGLVPIKQCSISVMPDIHVIPGGQSIGVKLKSAGVLVVGKYPLPQLENDQVRVGDYIIRMNGKEIRHLQQLGQLIEEAGKKGNPIQIEGLREGKPYHCSFHPYFDQQEKIYRIGLYVRDSAAGVGTLTFFDPHRKKYGALGHMITDVDTGQSLRVGEGRVVRSNVTSIRKGASGEPGEKRAIFFDEEHVLGNITRNTPFGVFGNMEKMPTKKGYNHPLPIALAEQVKEGSAKILTVVEGQRVEEYKIQIMHVMKQKFPATKGMIIKVTDPRLIRKTGGIVQGMSGSPIIQNGKLVGAVTHVLVNDPTSGYGTFIEWMLQDAGIIKKTIGSFGEPLVFSLLLHLKIAQKSAGKYKSCVEWNENRF